MMNLRTISATIIERAPYTKNKVCSKTIWLAKSCSNISSKDPWREITVSTAYTAMKTNSLVFMTDLRLVALLDEHLSLLLFSFLFFVLTMLFSHFWAKLHTGYARITFSHMTILYKIYAITIPIPNWISYVWMTRSIEDSIPFTTL